MFVNVAGGVRIEEPGADLAVALAVASAARGRAARGRRRRPLACFGEVGLTGELRYVAHAERRLEEAARFGLERVVLPARCLDDERRSPRAGGQRVPAPHAGARRSTRALGGAGPAAQPGAASAGLAAAVEWAPSGHAACAI